MALLGKLGEEDLRRGWEGREAVLDEHRPQPRHRERDEDDSGEKAGPGWEWSGLSKLRLERGREFKSVFLALSLRRRLAIPWLTEDKQALLTFYGFPGEHWDHLHAGNPIENVFGVVRHRTARTEGIPSQRTTKRRVFKLVQAAAKTRRRLKRADPSPLVLEGVTLEDDPLEKYPANCAA
jgi:hypothetical protein